MALMILPDQNNDNDTYTDRRNVCKYQQRDKGYSAYQSINLLNFFTWTEPIRGNDQPEPYR